MREGLSDSLACWAAGAALAAVLAAPAIASDSDDAAHAQHDHHAMHQGHDMAAGEDPHAHHRAMMANQDYQRSEHAYALADIPVIDMRGRPSTLLAELNHGKPVMVNFIFTTCTTICPVLSATFRQVQDALGPEAADVRMVSISIDPEQDTPSRLREYAQLYRAGEQWQFLTGQLDDMVAVQKAFGVYRGNKMNHEPTILLRTEDSGQWVRLDGLASASDVTREYRDLLASR